MKNLFFLIALFLFSSCGLGSLTSNTTIEPNNSFILGNNIHNKFNVKLTNNSKNNLKVFLAPIDGGTHSPQYVKPKQTVFVKVSKNTGLIIENNTKDTANVDLKVKGDTGLNMGYKN